MLTLHVSCFQWVYHYLCGFVSVCDIKSVIITLWLVATLQQSHKAIVIVKLRLTRLVCGWVTTYRDELLRISENCFSRQQFVHN